jgi:hypothetical protein
MINNHQSGYQPMDTGLRSASNQGPEKKIHKDAAFEQKIAKSEMKNYLTSHEHRPMIRPSSSHIGSSNGEMFS